MNLNQLLYFRTVCKHNNITKAADELHISQPAITKAIRELELELGVQLFHRANKKLSLTHEGEIFLEKSQSILMDVTSLLDEMKDLGENRRSTVKIGVPPVLAHLLLPRLTVETQKALRISLEIFEFPSDDLLDKIDNESLDVAVVVLEEMPYPNLDYKTLIESRLCFCTRKDNPMAKREQVSLKEVENEALIYYSSGSIIRDLFRRNHLSPHYVLHSSQMLTIINYIKAGIGSTFQFQMAFAREPEITAVPIQPSYPLNVAVVKKRGKKNSTVANRVYQYLSEDFQVLARD